MAKFAEKTKIELAKVSKDFENRIQNYEKQGINPLTKKLIERQKTQMQQALTKRQEELEQDRLRNLDKIKAGLIDDPEQLI